MKCASMVLGVCLIAPSVFGHHSTAEYSDVDVLEMTGEVVRVQWRNPHVRIALRASHNEGPEKIWEMEAQDLNSLDRAGISRDLVQVGQIVTVAGQPSSRRPDGFLLTNLRLPDEREILMLLSREPRWNGSVLGDRSAPRGRADEFVAPVDDIFRVWTTSQTNTPAFSEDPPFTPQGRAGYESFDPDDDPVLNCVSPGMPEAMTYIGPHPVEFVQLDNGDIRMLIESDDNERLIHMNPGTEPARQPPSPLGDSVGRWEDNVLVVTTSRIGWPYFKVRGIVAAPQSEAMEITERFTFDGERGELIYGFTASDPTTFTEPVTAERYHVWRYRPDMEVQPYECTLE